MRAGRTFTISASSAFAPAPVQQHKASDHGPRTAQRQPRANHATRPAARRGRVALAAAAALLLAAAAREAVATNAADDTDAGLPPHPRLILTPARAAALAALPASPDAFARRAAARVAAQAAWEASRQPPVPASARPFVQAVYSLGVGAAVGGAGGPAARAALSAAARGAGSSTAPWEPSAPGTVQLNTGEALHGAALALDWAYGDLTGDERAALVEAIVVHLDLVRSALGAAPPPWAAAFCSDFSNWNAVILGGTIVATLAVEGEPGAPSWVPDLRAAALANLSNWSARSWGPDGAWTEGPNYGGYATRYIVPTIASLLSATGGDAGLRATPGVLLAPRFVLAAVARTAPLPTLWAYFDARAVPETVGSYLALAAWAGDAPAAAGVKRLLDSLAPGSPVDDEETTAMNAPLACLYYTPLGAAGDDAELPLISLFRGPQVAMARAAWVDNATFIGFKGINSTVGNWAHTHLDGGSFVFATEGQWFAQDLESDLYSAPGYFDSSRFNLLRTNVTGHNTLSFGGHDPLCRILDKYAADCPAAPFVAFNATPALPGVDAFAVVNLTEGYARAGVALAAARGFIVRGGVEELVTVDEAAGNAEPLWWTVFTVANVSVAPDGRSASLSTANTTRPVSVAFLAAASDCAAATFSVAPLDLAPPLLPAPGVSVLRLAAPRGARCARVVVDVGVAPLAGVGRGVRPLGEWAADGPLV